MQLQVQVLQVLQVLQVRLQVLQMLVLVLVRLRRRARSVQLATRSRWHLLIHRRESLPPAHEAPQAVQAVQALVEWIASHPWSACRGPRRFPASVTPAWGLRRKSPPEGRSGPESAACASGWSRSVSTQRVRPRRRRQRRATARPAPRGPR